ncbi:MAG: hypothetical protein LLG97_15040, partial [Deltaproteobacteria bacterium]|nr:hypothetical protein [Deltaproteobacteria bacterium]
MDIGTLCEILSFQKTLFSKMFKSLFIMTVPADRDFSARCVTLRPQDGLTRERSILQLHAAVFVLSFVAKPDRVVIGMTCVEDSPQQAAEHLRSPAGFGADRLVRPSGRRRKAFAGGFHK